MQLSRVSQLERALASRGFVRLTRKFEDSYVRGYVLAVGRSHFLLALVSDRVVFDGFECFRIRDLKSIEADPHRTFAEAALKKRGLRRPRTPRLDLDSTRTILESAGALWPLVTIHREEVAPEVCYIGQVVGTNRTQVALREIGPDATWDQTATAHSLREITRISVGGSYEEALFLVGGASEA
jgi:hypothetical protein